MKMKREIRMEYRAVRGSHFSNRDAKIIGPCPQRLGAAHNNELAPERVVAEARRKTSPLHSYFEWDDAKAANLYRLKQAGEILRSITVTLVTHKGEKQEAEQPIRAWLSVKKEEPECEASKDYLPVTVIQNREGLIEQVIMQAHRELVGWSERYRLYHALKPFKEKFRPILAAIEEIEGQAVETDVPTSASGKPIKRRATREHKRPDKPIAAADIS
jgi:hypothetical protein